MKSFKNVLAFIAMIALWIATGILAWLFYPEDP